MPIKKRVDVFDENGNHIKQYESIVQASRDLGYATSTVKDALYSNHRVGGLVVKFAPKEPIKDEPINRKGRDVQVCYIQRDKETKEIVGVYAKMSDANKATGIPVPNISRNVRGLTQFANGFTFEKYDEYSPHYINPHPKRDRNEYRKYVRDVVEHLNENDWVVDDDVKRFHKWEKDYSKP